MRNIRTLAVALLLTASALLLNSCEKWGDDPIPQTPPTEMVTQTFGLKISTETASMSLKSWDPTTWVYNYSTVPAELKLTGTGTSAGTNYTKMVTVAELKLGTAMTILPGTYTATFETPHVRTTDTFSCQPYVGNEMVGSAVLGDVLDIKINNPNLHLVGSPITLTATLEDALIIVDVPNVAYVYARKTQSGVGVTNPFLLKNEANNFHYAYVNETPLWLNFTATTMRDVDASGYLKGNYYHLISAFGASAIVTIPGMIGHDIIVP